MDLTQIINLFSRWLHIIPVIVLVGGTIFMRFSLVPAANETEGSQQLREAIRKRWAKLVMISIAFLLVTGLYNAVMKIMGYELPRLYHHLVMVKIALGFVVFFFASRLAGRSEKAVKFRENETYWLNVLCGLMLALVLVAGYMKALATDQPKKVRDKPEASAPVDVDEVNQTAVAMLQRAD